MGGRGASLSDKGNAKAMRDKIKKTNLLLKSTQWKTQKYITVHL